MIWECHGFVTSLRQFAKSRLVYRFVDNDVSVWNLPRSDSLLCLGQFLPFVISAMSTHHQGHICMKIRLARESLPRPVSPLCRQRPCSHESASLGQLMESRTVSPFCCQRHCLLQSASLNEARRPLDWPSFLSPGLCPAWSSPRLSGLWRLFTWNLFFTLTPMLRAILQAVNNEAKLSGY